MSTRRHVVIIENKLVISVCLFDQAYYLVSSSAKGRKHKLLK